MRERVTGTGSTHGSFELIDWALVGSIALIWSRRHVAGLTAGFAGVLLMAAPDVLGATAPAVGVGFVLLAVAGYAVTNNVITPGPRRRSTCRTPLTATGRRPGRPPISPASDPSGNRRYAP